jgi:two-component system chemotaxis response regulator CheB
MTHRDIIVIGGSAGSIEVITDTVRALAPDIPAAVFVVVHFPGSVTSTLPRIISRAGTLPARHAAEGEPVLPGRVYVAPPNCHMVLEQDGIRLTSGPKENGSRPAVDPLFRSAAQHYGSRVIGVLLSGNLNDGTAGLLSIKRRGGLAVVQTPESAMYPGMPRSAIEQVQVDHVVPATELAGLLSRLVARTPPVDEVRRIEIMPTLEPDEIALADRSQQPGVPSTMSCPECHGVLWEAQDGDLVKFRCRVGHAYTDEALLAHQFDQLEAALWTALRSLEEHAALSRRLAGRAASRGHTHSASSFTEQAMDAEHHASIIRTVLLNGGKSAGMATVDAAGATSG